jgi:hypothetical protein
VCVNANAHMQYLSGVEAITPLVAPAWRTATHSKLLLLLLPRSEHSRRYPSEVVQHPGKSRVI